MALAGRSGAAMMRRYSYNGFNQLTGYADGMGHASYEYNANGLRIKKTVNDTVTDFTLNRTNLAKETICTAPKSQTKTAAAKNYSFGCSFLYVQNVCPVLK